MTQSSNMWGGRFSEGPSALLRALNDSFSFDRELLAEDVEGSIAWAREIAQAGVLTATEADAVVAALSRVSPVELLVAGGWLSGADRLDDSSSATSNTQPATESRVASGELPNELRVASSELPNELRVASGEWPGRSRPGDQPHTTSNQQPATNYEDVHSYVEQMLREQVGALAGKLHTGRSRNDQVATDLRLWLKKACDDFDALARALARALAQKALEESATAMPGYTHLKQAEPVTFGHWCMAYVEMLRRDLSRIADAKNRGDECPLGSAALAGTPLNIDRERLAQSLGFARATRNSLDAVSDRDLAAEYLFASSMLLNHLSRLAEDLIFMTSDEAGYAELPDAMATGSSRMPQKKNPDVLELTRGHAARSIGELTGFLALLKGLPLAYNKDLQLDKEPLFRTRTLLAVLLPALTSLITGLKINTAKMRAAAASPLLLATDAADELAAKGVPFREAHEIVSRQVVGSSSRQGDKSSSLQGDKSSSRQGDKPLDDSTTRPLDDSSTRPLDDSTTRRLDSSLAKKNAIGGTAPTRVAAAAHAALETL